MNTKAIFTVMSSTLAVVIIMPEKNSSSYGTGAVLYQLS